MTNPIGSVEFFPTFLAMLKMNRPARQLQLTTYSTVVHVSQSISSGACVCGNSYRVSRFFTALGYNSPLS